MENITFTTSQSWKKKISKAGSFVRSRLAESGIKHKDYADAVRLNQVSLSYKLKNTNDVWTYGELLMLIKQTDMSDEDILKLMKF